MEGVGPVAAGSAPPTNGRPASGRDPLINRASWIGSLPALTLLLLCVLRPIEIHPEAAAGAGLLLVLLASSLGGLPSSERSFSIVRPIVLYLVPLLALNGTLSASPHASIVVLARMTLLTILGIALAGVARAGGAVVLAVAASGAGSASALLALWQGTAGFSLEAEKLSAIEGPLREQALARLSSGRVFGTFLLPASLGGALAVTLPITIVLFGRSRRRVARTLAAASILVQSAAMIWTLSLGAWISLAAAAMLVLGIPMFLSARGRRLVLGTAVIVFLLVGSAVAVRRSLTPAEGPEDRPLAYRVGNWSVALRILESNPGLGTGLGTFGNVFPSYRREGMNESRYAHCTWLQLPAELGLGAVPLLMLALLGAYRLARRRQAAGTLETAAVLGVLAFLIQNTVDFTFYQPAVGALFVLAIAVATSGRLEPASPSAIGAAAPRSIECETPARAEEPADDSRSLVRVVARKAPLVVIGAGAGVVLLATGLSGLAREGALRAHGVDPDRERRALQLAVSLDPFDPDRRSELARTLAGSAGGPLLLERAIEEAQRAVALDPGTPYRWWDLATIELRRGHPAVAWTFAAKAASLHPLRSEYQDGLKDLESRLFGARTGGSGP